MHTREPLGVERDWYHVVWHTYRRRPLFKIPALARFCERELQRAAARRGWVVAQALFAPRQVHVLVQVPARVDRCLLGRELKRRMAEIVRRGRVGAGRHHPLWERDVWCSRLSPGRVVAVRRYLSRLGSGAVSVEGTRLNRQAASAPP